MARFGEGAIFYVILTWNYTNTKKREEKSIPLSIFGFKWKFIPRFTCKKGTRYFPQKSMNFIFSTRLSKKTPEREKGSGTIKIERIANLFSAASSPRNYVVLQL